MTSSTSGAGCPSCGNETRPGEKFCRQCGSPLAAVPIQTDVRAVTEDKKKTSRFQIALLAVMAALAVYLMYTFLGHLPGGDHPVLTGQPVVPGEPSGSRDRVAGIFIDATVDGGNIVIPVHLLKENRMLEFEYTDSTTTVPLLAYISGDGRLVTSFRMCEPCNAKKFTIEGDDLACGNCETRWVLNTLEGIQGNCQKYPPEPFPSRIVNDTIVIDLEYVKNWKIRL